MPIHDSAFTKSVADESLEMSEHGQSGQRLEAGSEPPSSTPNARLCVDQDSQALQDSAATSQTTMSPHLFGHASNTTQSMPDPNEQGVNSPSLNSVGGPQLPPVQQTAASLELLDNAVADSHQAAVLNHPHDSLHPSSSIHGSTGDIASQVTDCLTLYETSEAVDDQVLAQSLQIHASIRSGNLQTFTRSIGRLFIDQTHANAATRTRLDESIRTVGEDVGGLRGDVTGLKEDVTGLKAKVAGFKELLEGQEKLQSLTKQLQTQINKARGIADETRGIAEEAHAIADEARAVAGDAHRDVDAHIAQHHTLATNDVATQKPTRSIHGAANPEVAKNKRLLDRESGEEQPPKRRTRQTQLTGEPSTTPAEPDIKVKVASFSAEKLVMDTTAAKHLPAQVFRRVKELLADMPDKSMEGKKRAISAAELREVGATTCVGCHQYLRRPSTWSKAQSSGAACRTCTNMHRPCLMIKGEQLFIRPLAEELREGASAASDAFWLWQPALRDMRSPAKVWSQ